MPIRERVLLLFSFSSLFWLGFGRSGYRTHGHSLSFQGRYVTSRKNPWLLGARHWPGALLVQLNNSLSRAEYGYDGYSSSCNDF